MAKAENTVGDRSTLAAGVHPAVIRAAVIFIVWFLVVMAISFSGTIESDYLLAVVVGISVVFFTLVLSLAGYAATRDSAGEGSGSLADFLTHDVAIDRGSEHGWEATVEILMLPITLAIGATIIGLIFIVGA